MLPAPWKISSALHEVFFAVFSQLCVGGDMCDRLLSYKNSLLRPEIPICNFWSECLPHDNIVFYMSTFTHFSGWYLSKSTWNNDPKYFIFLSKRIFANLNFLKNELSTVKWYFPQYTCTNKTFKNRNYFYRIYYSLKVPFMLSKMYHRGPQKLESKRKALQGFYHRRPLAPNSWTTSDLLG